MKVLRPHRKSCLLKSAVIKGALRRVFAEDCDAIKDELHMIRSEITNCKATTSSEVAQVRKQVKDVEDGLSTWNDEVATQRSGGSEKGAEQSERQI